MAVQGCKKKGTPAYGMALHACTFPNPNFSRPGIKDTDLSAFHPDSVNRLLVDNALIHLVDPGVVADVHTLHTQITKKKTIKHQRMELNAQEREANGKMVFVKQYLVHGWCYAPKPYFSFLLDCPLVMSSPLPHHSAYYPLLTPFLTIHKA